MKKSHLIFIIAILIIIIAVITNPNQQTHQEKVKSTFDLFAGNNFPNEIEQGVIGFVGDFFIDKIIEKSVKSNNYILFSTTIINWNGKSKLIGIGAFGSVYLFKQSNINFCEPEMTSFSFARNMIIDNDVEKMIVNNEKKVEIYIKKDSLKKNRYRKLLGGKFETCTQLGPHFYFFIGSLEVFKKSINEVKNNSSIDNFEILYEKKDE